MFAAPSLGAFAVQIDSVQLTLEQLYTRYYPPLREKCRRMLGNGDDASDVAQETFTRFWRHREDVPDSRAAVAWLYRASTRLAIDRLRTRAVRKNADLGDVLQATVPLPELNPEVLLESQRVLGSLVARLDGAELELMILTCIDGLTQSEMVEVLQVSESTVRRRQRRLDEKLAALRKELGRS